MTKPCVKKLYRLKNTQGWVFTGVGESIKITVL